MRDGGPRFRSSSEAFDTCTNQRRDELNMVDPPLITRSRARSWTSAGSSMTLDASLTVTRPLLHRQSHRRSGGTVFRQHPGGVNHCSPVHLQQLGRFPLGKPQSTEEMRVAAW